MRFSTFQPMVTDYTLRVRFRLANNFSLSSQNPPHWHLDLGQHYCDHLGRSFIFLTCIECLEGEDWKLRGTNCMTHYDQPKDTTKFFFHRD